MLEKFLQQKVAVTTAILQADDKLTENERRICGKNFVVDTVSSKHDNMNRINPVVQLGLG